MRMTKPVLFYEKKYTLSQHLDHSNHQASKNMSRSEQEEGPEVDVKAQSTEKAKKIRLAHAVTSDGEHDQEEIHTVDGQQAQEDTHGYPQRYR